MKIRNDLYHAGSADPPYGDRGWVAVASCGVVGTLSAALLHWRYRFSLNPDAVSYLEIARKYAEGDWSDAVNLVWSPLYSWLLVPVIRLFPDRPVDVLPAVHLIQLTCVVLALWAGRKIEGMSWSVLGTVLFGAVVLVPVGYLTPDILAMALSLWTLARLVDELDRSATARRYVTTGALAGLAYLAKSFFALYFAVLLVLCWRGSEVSTRSRKRFLAYLAGFLLVAGPWVAMLSLTKGQFAFGQAGTINFLSHGLIRDVDETVGRVGAFVRVHELAFPTALPEHYEPIPRFLSGYHLDPYRLTRLVALNLSAMFFGYYPSDFPLYWPLAAILVAGVGVFLSPFQKGAPQSRQSTFLLAAGAAGVALFLMSHVESRYLAPFPALWLAAVSCRLAAVETSARKPLVAAISVLGVLFWLFPFWMFLNDLRGSHKASFDREQKTALIDWMRENGTRYAVVGPTYELGFPAWGAGAQLVASVDSEGLVAQSCQDVTMSWSRTSADALLSARAFESCGDWQSIPGTGWFYWDR